MTTSIESIVLANMIVNEQFMRKVIPFVQPAYFSGTTKKVFASLCGYVAKYNNQPNRQALLLAIQQSGKYDEDQLQQAVTILDTVYGTEAANDNDWLMDVTEKWCQDRALHNAIMESIQIIDGKHAKYTKNALPDILQKALAVTFDSSVGHDYIDDMERRYDFYHEDVERLEFDLEMLNKITRGGLPKKTLNIILAGTGVGKSLIMCHCAAGALMQGKNVLYITMEMAEERIAERIDANLMDIPLDQLGDMSKDMFTDRVSKIGAGTQGRLIIKEYPTGQANSSHFRALLNELKLKRKFVPDIIFIDYLNICSSSRMKAMGGSINSYTYIKSIAEELRGLGVEFDVPIVSATQTNRDGFSNSDPDLTNTSESFGLPATADLMFAAITNDELEQMGVLMIKQLKNRYNDINKYKRFLIGVDRSKMKLFDADPEKQEQIMNNDDTPDIPVFDSTQAGRGIQQESTLVFDG